MARCSHTCVLPFCVVCLLACARCTAGPACNTRCRSCGHLIGAGFFYRPRSLQASIARCCVHTRRPVRLCGCTSATWHWSCVHASVAIESGTACRTTHCVPLLRCNRSNLGSRICGLRVFSCTLTSPKPGDVHGGEHVALQSRSSRAGFGGIQICATAIWQCSSTQPAMVC